MLLRDVVLLAISDVSFLNMNPICGSRPSVALGFLVFILDKPDLPIP